MAVERNFISVSLNAVSFEVDVGIDFFIVASMVTTFLYEAIEDSRIFSMSLLTLFTLDLISTFALSTSINIR